MSGWVLVAVPASALVILLVHDFMAGLGEDRLWADPSVSDPESIRSRAVRAGWRDHLKIGYFHRY